MEAINSEHDSTDSLRISSSSRKRPYSDSTTTGKKRSASYSTYVKWRREFDKECQTISWLDCDVTGKEGKRIVDRLKCKVCLKYKSRIESRRNYSDKWLVGAESIRSEITHVVINICMLCLFTARNPRDLLLMLVNHLAVPFVQCYKDCRKKAEKEI